MTTTPPPVVVMTRSDLDATIAAAARAAATAAVAEALAKLPRQQAPRPQHLTKKDAAKLLGMSYPTLEKLISTGRIKLNDAGRVPITEIDRMGAASA